MIWDALDEELGAASVKEVGMLLAYTPMNGICRWRGQSPAARSGRPSPELTRRPVNVFTVAGWHPSNNAAADW